MGTVHTNLLNWRAVLKISFYGWIVSTLAAGIGFILWVYLALPHYYSQAIPRVIAANGLDLIGIKTRVAYLMDYSPVGFINRVKSAGIDLSGYFEIIHVLPLIGAVIVLFGWAVYLLNRRSKK